ncbi:transposase-like zinc ribbon protein [Mucilaginibacter gracilis]|uniref:Transposase-like zinc ribbon protein n=1 Tax=Mucilaginibacter gracilis TaxID=423350 RepID=A0A495J7V2_9SPHI|nr:IS1595 family transposase [Mucilaginibacter gracilis]RKR85066.1 transposase-like zinc ribbon protein [Mucilaginibacter gracilis]
MQLIKFKTIFDLISAFPTEKSCHHYLASTRWNTGEIICPHPECGFNECYVFKDGIRYKCKGCKKQFNAKTKTFMQDSNLPTIKWIMAMYLMVHKKGISSVQLGLDLGVTQPTAWFILQRVRGSFETAPKESFAGTVEIDETFVGGKNKNRHYRRRMQYKELTGRTFPDKTTVFGMYERETGRVRAMVISRQEFKNMAKVITYNVQPGSTLMTDDWSGYKRLNKMYTRHSIDHGKWIYADGEVTTNRVENFWSHLKRGLHGTYISVSAKHLNKYVKEFEFRHNHRHLPVQEQIECIIANMVSPLKLKSA